MNFEFDEEDKYSINFERVLYEESFLPVTRLLAANLIKQQYMSVGDFIKTLNSDTLEQLNDISEDEEHPNFDQIVLITEMLSAAEGTNTSGVSEAHQRVNLFTTWLVLESLKRKGLVRIFYENISFGEDMSEKIVVQKIE